MNRKIRLVDADDLVISLIRLDDAEPRSDAQRTLILTLIDEVNAAPKMEYDQPTEGRWETIQGLDGIYFCSSCKSARSARKSRYCPDCGARMADSITSEGVKWGCEYLHAEREINRKNQDHCCKRFLDERVNPSETR